MQEKNHRFFSCSFFALKESWLILLYPAFAKNTKAGLFKTVIKVFSTLLVTITVHHDLLNVFPSGWFSVLILYGLWFILRNFINARTINTLTSTARLEFSTLVAIIAPCSVKTNGKVFEYFSIERWSQFATTLFLFYDFYILGITAGAKQPLNALGHRQWAKAK